MAKKETPPPPSRKGSKPVEQASVSRQGDRRILWIVAVAAVALVAALVAIALVNNRPPAAPIPSGTSVAERVGQPVDRRSIGDPNAPVVIEVYEDYQCGHCRDFTVGLESTIRDDLVKSGVARLVYMNRFVINAGSKDAAAAAECAADQGRFWEYHDGLFANIASDPQIIQDAKLKRLASDIGLDTDTFAECFDTRQHYEALIREDQEAANRGVNGTPTVFINGERYQGDFAAEPFKAAVEKAREAKQGS